MSEQMDAAQTGGLVGGEEELGSPAGVALAKRFHEAYERLAPTFGYNTRAESALPWEQVPLNNRRLMVAVCDELLADVKRLLRDVEG